MRGKEAKAIIEELQKLRTQVEYWHDLTEGYRTFYCKTSKAQYPYLKIHVPSYVMQLLHLRGGEILEVKMKVVSYISRYETKKRKNEKKVEEVK